MGAFLGFLGGAFFGSIIGICLAVSAQISKEEEAVKTGYIELDKCVYKLVKPKDKI